MNAKSDVTPNDESLPPKPEEGTPQSDANQPKSSIVPSDGNDSGNNPAVLSVPNKAEVIQEQPDVTPLDEARFPKEGIPAESAASTVQNESSTVPTQSEQVHEPQKSTSAKSEAASGPGEGHPEKEVPQEKLDKPPSFGNTSFISPEEQVPPKKRGRKPKQSDAAAENASGSTKRKARQCKAKKDEPKNGKKDKTQKETPSSPKKGKKSKKCSENKKEKKASPKRKASAGSKKAKKGEENSSDKTKPDDAADQKAAEKKARYSRKSAAYHREKTRMLKLGHTPDEAKLAAQKVP